MNLYAMVANNPIQKIDLLGTSPAPAGWKWVPRLVGGDFNVSEGKVADSRVERITEDGARRRKVTQSWLEAYVEAILTDTSIDVKAAIFEHQDDYLELWTNPLLYYNGRSAWRRFEKPLERRMDSRAWTEVSGGLSCDDDGKITLAPLEFVDETGGTKVSAASSFKAIEGGDGTTDTVRVRVAAAAWAGGAVTVSEQGSVSFGVSFNGVIDFSQTSGGNYEESYFMGIKKKHESVHLWKCVCVKDSEEK